MGKLVENLSSSALSLTLSMTHQVRQSTAEELLAVYGTGDSDSELDSILIHTKW